MRNIMCSQSVKENIVRKLTCPRSKNMKTCNMCMKRASARLTKSFHHTGSFDIDH